MTTSLNSGGIVPVMELRHRVRLARDYAGMSQEELAKATGMARSGIAKIEAGDTNPRRTSISLIAFATGVNRDWLETGETPAPDNPGGGEVVRHQGIEPRTHCLSLVAA